MIFRVTTSRRPLTGPPVVGSRLVFNGRAGNGTYLTMPSNCAGEKARRRLLNVDSHDAPPKPTPTAFTTPTSGRSAANAVEFKPTIDVTSTGDTSTRPNRRR